MKITNNTRQTLDFVTTGKVKDGVPPTGSVKPGETADIDIIENAHFKGLVLAGAISVPAKTAEKVEAAVAEPTKGK
jgi:hypothetical protein